MRLVNDDDDLGFENVVPFPAKFDKMLLLSPPLIFGVALGRALTATCELFIQALDDHMDFNRDMREFQIAAAIEIESLTEGGE